MKCLRVRVHGRLSRAQTQASSRVRGARPMAFGDEGAVTRQWFDHFLATLRLTHTRRVL
jgi:hypothetical protein